MLLMQVQDNITELMDRFVYQIKAYTSLGRTDINRLSEIVLVPLLREIFSYNELRNLNSEETMNYPGIDLADDKARIAFQVTSTSDNEKIKYTLRKFCEYELYKKYDRLVIYILTTKQKSYSEASYADIIQGNFKFAPKKDIWDSLNLLDAIKGFPVEKAERVLDILQRNFGPPDQNSLRKVLNTPQASQFIKANQLKQETETLSSNLLPISFPKTLYLADIAEDITTEISPIPNRPNLFQNSTRNIKRVSHRDAVQAALRGLNLRFGSDWNCFERKIITFHNLSDPHLPLNAAIELGTVTPISTDEFCRIDKDHENILKYLLRRCLQQLLYERNIVWQNEANLFIFRDLQEHTTRLEKWYSSKENIRAVCTPAFKKDSPSEIWYYKHLAFGVQFYNFQGNWYLGVRPDWFFSYDGYHTSYFNSENLKWLKRHENNTQVFNHLRFIVHFLSSSKNLLDDNLLEEYPFLKFGDLEKFSGAPRLVDKSWNPPEPAKTNKTKKSNDKNIEQVLIQSDMGF